MQDDLDLTGAEDVIRAAIARGFGAPNPATSLSPEGQQRLEQSGFTHVLAHLAVSAHLGPLDHGEVYALPVNDEDPARFTAERATKKPLSSYLLELHQDSPFEVARMELPDIPEGEDWQ